MMCCEVEWADFVSYCPRDQDDDERLCLPDGLRLFVKRLYRDEDLHRRMEEDATRTIEEAIALVEKLRSRMKLPKPSVEIPQELALGAGEEPIF